MLGLPPLLAVAAARGLDAEALLREVGIAPEILREPHAGVPVARVHALVRRLLARTGDAALGLEAARHYHAETFGLLGAVAALAPTARKVVRLFLDYVDLTYTFFVVDFVETDDGLGRIVIVDDEDLGPLRRFYVDRELAFVCAIAREFWPDRHRGLLHAVEFDYPEPPEADRYRAYFPCPVRFGAERATFVLDLAHDERRAGQNALGLALLEEQLSAFAGARRDGEPLTRRVRREMTLAIALRQTLPELSTIAAGMGLSERALRRRLAAEGTSFRVLADEVIARLAKQYLADRTRSVADVAARLGYAEPASFVRAFRRAVGTTPDAFRSAKGNGIDRAAG